MNDKMLIKEHFESGIRDTDQLSPVGIFESWVADKKTGIIVPGSFKREVNTVRASTFLFCGTLLNPAKTETMLTEANLFADSENDPDNVDNTWISTNGDDGVIFADTIPTTLLTDDLGDTMSVGDLQAVFKTIATDVDNDDQNFFVINGELDGPFTNASGYLMLVKDLYWNDPDWEVDAVMLSRQQPIDITSSRTYFFKWTLTF